MHMYTSWTAGLPWTALENLGGSWRVLGDLGGSWRILEDLGGSWRILEDLGGSWRIGASEAREHSAQCRWPCTSHLEGLTTACHLPGVAESGGVPRQAERHHIVVIDVLGPSDPAGPDRAGPSWTELGRAGPSDRAGPSWTGPGRTELDRAGPSWTE